MPNNLLFADMSMFPVIGEEEETRSALKKILNYQFLLTEQLRYTLYNLGEENLNEAEWHSLTEPIYARIQDADGNIAELSLNAKELRAKLSDAEGNIGQLSLTAESLSTQISNAQGDISTLKQTAESLSTQISNAQGDISTLKQTAQSLSTQISNAQGDISTLKQTAESLSSKITNARGDISSLQLTAESLSSRISNAQGDISTLSQTAQSLSTQISNAQDSVSTLRQDVESITLSVENGDKSSTISLKMDETVISSGKITLAGDVVFVDDLQDGTTKISGANIQTGMIQAIDIAGCRFYASADGDSYAEMDSESFRIYDEKGDCKIRLDTSPNVGLDGTHAARLRLGDTSYAYVQKYYSESSENMMWVGNGTFACGILFNFDRGSYKIFGSPDNSLVPDASQEP